VTIGPVICLGGVCAASPTRTRCSAAARSLLSILSSCRARGESPCPSTTSLSHFAFELRAATVEHYETAGTAAMTRPTDFVVSPGGGEVDSLCADASQELLVDEPVDELGVVRRTPEVALHART